MNRLTYIRRLMGEPGEGVPHPLRNSLSLSNLVKLNPSPPALFPLLPGIGE